MRTGDTIVALSSGGLPSGVAIIRLSGPGCADILVQVLGRVPQPRHLQRVDIRDVSGMPLDDGMAVYFQGPKSFTGEDCAELHLHGSQAVVKAVLRLLTGFADVRLAEAGEFTRRAFENGKLDLTGVEGLGDLIVAETEGQRRLALDRLSGVLSTQIEHWRTTLLDRRAEIEALLDFSDEGDVPEDLSDAWRESLSELKLDLGRAAQGADSGRIVREGFRVALAGKPNVGKSSLLNALSRSDVAIVTDEAGTTRDVREVMIDLDGQLVVLVDMAGLRQTDSLAESEGVRRAEAEIARADLVLWLRGPDVADDRRPDGHAKVLEIGTKADLGAMADVAVSVSVRTNSGIDRLLTLIADQIGLQVSSDTHLVSRERDRMALLAAAASIEHGLLLLAQPELAAEQLRMASDALARLIGVLDPETVLDRLFSAFCIGK